MNATSSSAGRPARRQQGVAGRILAVHEALDPACAPRPGAPAAHQDERHPAPRAPGPCFQTLHAPSRPVSELGLHIVRMRPLYAKQDSKSPPFALTPDKLTPGRLEHNGRGSIQQYGLGWVWSRRRLVLFPWAVTNRSFCEGLLEGYHNIGERHGHTGGRTCHAPLSAVNWTRKEAQSCARFMLAIPAAAHACPTGRSSTRHRLERSWLYGIVTLPLVIVSVQGCLGYALS
jgi:hypothetical protein